MSALFVNRSAAAGRHPNGTPAERVLGFSETRISLETIMLQFLRGEPLRAEVATEIVQQAALVLRTEPNMLAIADTVVVVGDIQGQFYDLVKILAVCGSFETSQYLFLGNYIGNGGFNLECLLFLLAAKVTYPHSVFLIRGSNESKFMADVLQLGDECQLKYSSTLLPQLYSVFNCLPLAAIVGEKFFCVHSGLSPDVSHVNDIGLIHRFRHIPTRGAMCDMVWSEPDWDTGNVPYNNMEGASGETYVPQLGMFETRPLFITNKQRGLSYVFNFACAKRFVSANNLLCIVRGHEVQEAGFKLYRPHPNHLFPCMISVFSAPNYCASFGNKGAVLVVSGETINFKQFDPSPHPCVLQGRNAFSWSLPFLESNLMAIFLTLLSGSDYEPAGGDTPDKGSDDGGGGVTPLL